MGAMERMGYMARLVTEVFLVLEVKLVLSVWMDLRVKLVRAEEIQKELKVIAERWLMMAHAGKQDLQGLQVILASKDLLEIL